MRAVHKLGSTARSTTAALLCVGTLVLAASISGVHGLDAEIGDGSTGLASYMGFGHDPMRDEIRSLEEEREREEFVAACMRERGFAYQPEVAVIVGWAPRGELSATRPSDPRAPSVNDRRLVEMTDDERKRYHVALYGIENPNDPSVAGGISGESCVGRAGAAVPGVYAAKNALRDELYELSHAIRSDARVRDVEESWLYCVRAQGYDVESMAEFLTRFAEPASVRARSLKGERRRQIALEHGEACDERVGVQRTIEAVRREAEAAFVQSHRQLLDELGVRSEM